MAVGCFLQSVSVVSSTEMVHLPTWIPGAAVRLIDRLWPKRPELTIEIRQVCFDKILSSVEADFSDYRIDLYLFPYVWVVNTKETPTAIKEWKLTVLANNQPRPGERVEDISKWRQHIKVNAVQHGFPVVKDIYEPLNSFPTQPLQHGIPSEGWVCFIVRAVKESLMQNASVTLTITDSFGHKHFVKSQGPWPCNGVMGNPERF